MSIYVNTIGPFLSIPTMGIMIRRQLRNKEKKRALATAVVVALEKDTSSSV